MTIDPRALVSARRKIAAVLREHPPQRSPILRDRQKRRDRKCTLATTHTPIPSGLITRTHPFGARQLQPTGFIGQSGTSLEAKESQSHNTHSLAIFKILQSIHADGNDPADERESRITPSPAHTQARMYTRTWTSSSIQGRKIFPLIMELLRRTSTSSWESTPCDGLAGVVPVQ